MFITAGEILNRVASETGLEEVPDPYASQDPKFVKMRRLLQSAATDLLDSRPAWPQLIQQYELTTVDQQTSYSLPPDYRGMIPSTGWNRTLRTPLAGPASPAQWEHLLAWNAGTTTLRLVFRLTPTQILVWPAPSAGIRVAFEYASSFWVQSAGAEAPDKYAPTVSGDVVWFDDGLIVRALKLKFLQSEGFDTTVAAREYRDALDSAISRSGGAPKLQLAKRILPQSSHTVGEAAGGAADPFGEGVLY